MFIVIPTFIWIECGLHFVFRILNSTCIWIKCRLRLYFIYWILHVFGLNAAYICISYLKFRLNSANICTKYKDRWEIMLVWLLLLSTEDTSDLVSFPDHIAWTSAGNTFNITYRRQKRSLTFLQWWLLSETKNGRQLRL